MGINRLNAPRDAGLFLLLRKEGRIVSEVKTRSNGINPTRRIMVLDRTFYISIPLSEARQHDIKKGSLYEFEYADGNLIFRPVVEVPEGG